jgi:hypothetical protein
MLLVPVPWAARVLALPLLARWLAQHDNVVVYDSRVMWRYWLKSI